MNGMPRGVTASATQSGPRRREVTVFLCAALTPRCGVSTALGSCLPPFHAQMLLASAQAAPAPFPGV